jgi:acylaminoacyl-peptidase
MTVEETFQKIASIPQITELLDCQIDEDHMLLQIVSTRRDYTRKTKVKAMHSLHFEKKSGRSHGSFPVELDETFGLSSVSPSKKRQCRLRTVGEKRYLEFTGADAMTIEVTKIHGDFYNDGYFGTVQWDQDESRIVYVAAPIASEEDDKFDFYADAGEGYTGKLKPSMVWVDLSSRKAQLVDLPFWGISQPNFHPKGGFTFIGIEKEPTRLGIKFCTNRRTGLYRYLDGEISRLNDPKLNARYPVLNASKTKVYYLSHNLFGPHDSCARLMEYDFETGIEKTIVPVIESSDDYESFPGIFSPGLIQNSVVSTPKGEVLVLMSAWRSRTVILSIHINSGKVENLTKDGMDSWSLLKVDSNHVFAVKSSLNRLGALHYTTFDSLAWKEVYAPIVSPETSHLFQDIDYKVSLIPSRSTDLEVIFVQNKTKLLSVTQKASPLIVFPHGGPHGVISTSFSIAVSSFTALGFVVVLVNYTGSTGFGNRSIQALIGKIGDLDVQDTHSAAQWASNQDNVDKHNIFLYGGSHGGFLTAHLLAREPEFYTAGCLRNPVINVGAMISNTDIPDWCCKLY